MTAIHFKAKLSKINSWTILELPKDVSANLPSRGMTFVKGTINGFPLQIVLDPDGKGSHWFKVDDAMMRSIKTKVGDTVTMVIVPSKEWPEPVVPKDIKDALMSTTEAYATWMDTTPMARWEWVRWIGSTKSDVTREKRINVSLSKLQRGMRRPCCFNRSMCLIPEVSHNGVLLEPIFYH